MISMPISTRCNHFRGAVAALLGLGFLASLPSASLAAENAPPPPKPNVLMLVCDQLNAAVLSCYGGPVRTPNVDRIAREGVRFTQATCTTPFCSPSRASLATGLYPHTHGIIVNCGDAGDAKPTKQLGITIADTTLEKLLNQQGYATHHYGKWHLFGERLPYYPDMYSGHPDYSREMADIFAKVQAGDPANRMQWYAWALPVTIAPELKTAVENLGDRWKDVRLQEFVAKMGRLNLPLQDVYEVRTTDRTVSQIRQLSGKQQPFMITCSFNGPHDPNATPSPYYERFDPSKIVLPANRDVREARFEKHWSRRIVADLGEPGLREFLRIYYGMVLLIDDQVGRILRTLEETGALDNTVVIFTTDHGDMAGGHGMVWKSTEAFYDEIVRVPLLIRYPRLFPAERCDLAVDFTDLMPTVLDLLGQPIPRQLQGQSLVPFLTGRKDTRQARPFSFCERVNANAQHDRRVLPGTPASFMVRGQGWKYIRYANNKPEEFLYNLADDPGETRNLIGDSQYDGQRKRLARELDAWLARTGWPKETAGKRKD
jgi:arylsulfatase A-like enzyme